MAAGVVSHPREIGDILKQVTDRVWDMNDVAALIAAQEVPIAMRGPYKKKAA